MVPQTPSQGCHSLMLAPQPCSGHPLTHTLPILRLLVPTAVDGGRGRRGHLGSGAVWLCGAGAFRGPVHKRHGDMMMMMVMMVMMVMVMMMMVMVVMMMVVMVMMMTSRSRCLHAPAPGHGTFRRAAAQPKAGG